MAWHKLTSGTGEVQFVASLDGIDLDAWTALAIVDDRCPDPLLHETVDGAGNIVVDLAAAKAAKAGAIDARLAQAFLAGFTPSTGPCAGKMLQTRDDTDRTNWLTAKDAWRDQRDAGHGAERGAVIRTGSNEMIVCSYDDGFTTLQAMADWGFALMGNSWTLKDHVAAAADQAALDAIDIESGWQ